MWGTPRTFSIQEEGTHQDFMLYAVVQSGDGQASRPRPMPRGSCTSKATVDIAGFLVTP